MRSSRKQQAAELRRTWTVYEPQQAGVPITRRDIADADERAARSAIGSTPVFDSVDSGSNPDGPTNLADQGAEQVPMRE